MKKKIKTRIHGEILEMTSSTGCPYSSSILVLTRCSGVSVLLKTEAIEAQHLEERTAARHIRSGAEEVEPRSDICVFKNGVLSDCWEKNR